MNSDAAVEGFISFLPNSAIPPGNFENAYSRRCISLILGAKSRAFRTDVYQVTGNKVMMNCSLDCF